MENTILLDIRHALQQLGINPAKAMDFLAFAAADQGTAQLENPKQTALTDDKVYNTRDMER